MVFIKRRLTIARTHDLKYIPRGVSGVLQTWFECWQSGRAGVWVYGPSRIHRFKWLWRAVYRGPPSRLDGKLGACAFLGSAGKIGKGDYPLRPENMNWNTVGQN